MKIFKSAISGIMSFLIGITFLYLEIGGIYHSATKHSTIDFVVSIFIPPWAWYRAVEAFWHDDFAGIDWDKRLKEDAKWCIYFLSKGTEKNDFEFNKDLKEFSKYITKYPEGKINILENASKIFIKYWMAIINDMGITFENYLKSGHIDYSYTKKTLEIENRLKGFLNKNDFEKLKKDLKPPNFDNVLFNIIERVTKDETDINIKRKKLEHFRKMWVLELKAGFSRNYKIIFNEELEEL